jgi:hypothetical protein
MLIGKVKKCKIPCRTTVVALDYLKSLLYRLESTQLLYEMVMVEEKSRC